MAELLRFNDDCDFGRVDRLQVNMNARVATICPQRAEIITESFMRTEGEPVVVRRAKAFADILDKMSVYVERDSLITELVL